MSAIGTKLTSLRSLKRPFVSKASEKVWNFTSARPLIVRGQHRFGRKHVRTFLITLTALGVVAIALPAVSANAQDRTVVVTRDGDHDRGLHRGWTAAITMDGAITVIGAITMPRSWSLRRTGTITTIDLLLVDTREQVPGPSGRVLCFWKASAFPSMHVCFWHKADICFCTAHVRFRGQSGHLRQHHFPI